MPHPIDPFPPLDPDAPGREVARLADGVAATLRIAQALVESDRRVDLSGLDRMVGVLCARMLDLPADQGRLLQPRLVTLLLELDRLAIALPPP